MTGAEPNGDDKGADGTSFNIARKRLGIRPEIERAILQVVAEGENDLGVARQRQSSL